MKFTQVNKSYLRKPSNIMRYRLMFIMVKKKLDFWTNIRDNFAI